MFQNRVKIWLRQLISGQRAVKRVARPFGMWIDRAELLEERQVLSAVTGLEELPVGAEVASTTEAPGKHAGHHGKKVTFPTVTGVWNLTASAVIDGDPPLVFTGTVDISQNKGKVTGNVQLQGLPLFEIKGKLSKTNLNSLSGSTKFPVDFGNGDFHAIKGSLTLNYAQGFASFSGTVNRTIFGHTIVVTLTGNKTM